jgi:hypothetical protein
MVWFSGKQNLYARPFINTESGGMVFNIRPPGSEEKDKTQAIGRLQPKA